MRLRIPFWPRSAAEADPFADLDPQGPQGVAQRGHREYVGGLWEEIGQLQFDFLCSQGLQPEHVLLDIACGSLRLGVKAIPYLKPGNYMGVEKEQTLLDAGVQQELGRERFLSHRPRLLCNDSFAFERLGVQADMAMAQSLFTHVPASLIERCLVQLRPWLKPDGVFFATYFEVDQPRCNPDQPHDHGYFAYTKEEMIRLGDQCGYQANYLGDWRHPRGQMMVAYRPVIC